MNEHREKIIQNYLEGYNEFDVEKMTHDFNDEIVFQNIQDEKVSMTINGISDFKEQAEQAKSYFETRKQKVTSISHNRNETEIEIDYSAVLAIDFPNGLKKGHKLELKGTSIFTFKDNKIIQLTDKIWLYIDFVNWQYNWISWVWYQIKVIYGEQVELTIVSLLNIDDIYKPNNVTLDYTPNNEDKSKHKLIWSNGIKLLS